MWYSVLRERALGKVQRSHISPHNPQRHIFSGGERNETAVLRHRWDPSAALHVVGFRAESHGRPLHDINEILEWKDINDEHNAMILGENAKRFYNL